MHIVCICNIILLKLILFVGVRDSSGIEFTYTDEPQKHRAGILTVGHSVYSGMIIPPGRDDYTITGMCSGQCTEKVCGVFYYFMTNESTKCTSVTNYYSVYTTRRHHSHWKFATYTLKR